MVHQSYLASLGSAVIFFPGNSVFKSEESMVLDAIMNIVNQDTKINDLFARAAMAKNRTPSFRGMIRRSNIVWRNPRFPRLSLSELSKS